MDCLLCRCFFRSLLFVFFYFCERDFLSVVIFFASLSSSSPLLLFSSSPSHDCWIKLAFVARIVLFFESVWEILYALTPFSLVLQWLLLLLHLSSILFFSPAFLYCVHVYSVVVVDILFLSFHSLYFLLFTPTNFISLQFFDSLCCTLVCCYT